MDKQIASQNSAILAHLRSGKAITAIEALNICGCFRLSARIYDLHRLGHNIKSSTVCVKNKHIASYSLITEAL